jgi:predicted DNA-binding ribbon-helix-helix protein
MKKRKVKIGEQRYLVQLEPYFWQSVDKILDEEKITFSFLCTELNRLKTAYSLSKSLRLFTLIYFRNSAEQNPDQAYPTMVAEEPATFEHPDDLVPDSTLMMSLLAFSQHAEHDDMLADPA